MNTEQQGELIKAAQQVRANAYCPHSDYAVGAALLTQEGQLFVGCNVENDSYGLTICAERVAVFTAVASGARTVQAIAVATKEGGSPCGACRQVLAQFHPKDGSEMQVFLINHAGEIVRETTLTELLPFAFGL
jgi:cytidine deaminase